MHFPSSVSFYEHKCLILMEVQFSSLVFYSYSFLYPKKSLLQSHRIFSCIFLSKIYLNLRFLSLIHLECFFHMCQEVKGKVFVVFVCFFGVCPVVSASLLRDFFFPLNCFGIFVKSGGHVCEDQLLDTGLFVHTYASTTLSHVCCLCFLKLILPILHSLFFI